MKQKKLWQWALDALVWCLCVAALVWVLSQGRGRMALYKENTWPVDSTEWVSDK